MKPEKPIPPQLAKRFLLWFLRDDLAEEVLGDLDEQFLFKTQRISLFRARLNYWYQVFNYLRPFAINKSKSTNSNHYIMFNHYFKIGWRNLLRNKSYSLINIGGLAIGMTVALLIGLWIQYETSFDAFHENGDRIGLIRKHTLFNNIKGTQLSVPLPLRDELKDNYPEVKRISRFNEQRVGLKADDRKTIKSGLYVDPDFLEMFSFPLINGNVKTALSDPNSIVLTKSLAELLFSDQDPMGKVIRIDNQYDAQVTGVVKDIPGNSFFNFIGFLAPFEYRFENIYLQRFKDNWGSNVTMNCLELHEGVSIREFSNKIASLNLQKDPGSKNQKLSIQPLSKLHLYDEYENWENAGGKIVYVRMFGIIGVLILLIACINFMNLATARSEKRAREVGIRKSVGSPRIYLISQFFSESAMIAFFAYLLSVVLIFLCLPYLNDLGFENIKFDASNVYLWIFGLIVCFTTAMIAGSYPALYLSSFQPVKVLKGAFKQQTGTVVFRKLLVLSQFVISIGLIISTLVVFDQINYVKDRPIGYNPTHMLSVRSSKDIAQNFTALKQALLNTGFVEAVAKTSSPITEVYNKWSDFSWDGKDPDSRIALEALMTEWDYEKAAGLKFIQGRPFSPEFSTDSNAVILNEAALEIIGYEDPIGRTMKSGGQEITIVGVVENVLMKDLFEPIAPGVILFNANVNNTVLLRLNQTANLKDALASIEEIFGRHNPSYPFEYSFVNEEFNKKLATENQVGKLAGLFAGLAIIISCLGLFGLVSYMAERRTKEIGIRKVLGANVLALWKMLSKDFMVLAIVSCFIAAPIAYFLMQNWLQQYEYRTEISLWIFAVAGFGVLVIMLLTVSYQILKAALANPVKSLKSE